MCLGVVFWMPAARSRLPTRSPAPGLLGRIPAGPGRPVGGARRSGTVPSGEKRARTGRNGHRRAETVTSGPERAGTVTSGHQRAGTVTSGHQWAETGRGAPPAFAGHDGGNVLKIRD